jgi:hypothetical protein
MRRYVRLRWIVFVAFTPFVLLGLLVLVVRAYGLVRFDPAYFTNTYREQYPTSGDAARRLEGALQSGDQGLLAELQGLRRPAEFAMSPSMVFVMLWERTDRYTTYLYIDMETYERYPHYFEKVSGRWVVVPADLTFYVRSGRWQGVFWPLAIIWWLLGTVAIGLVWIFRSSERARARLLGEE